MTWINATVVATSQIVRTMNMEEDLTFCVRRISMNSIRILCGKGKYEYSVSDGYVLNQI